MTRTTITFTTDTPEGARKMAVDYVRYNNLFGSVMIHSPRPVYEPQKDPSWKYEVKVDITRNDERDRT